MRGFSLYWVRSKNDCRERALVPHRIGVRDGPLRPVAPLLDTTERCSQLARCRRLARVHRRVHGAHD